MTGTGDTPLLSFREVSRAYGRLRALHRVSLDVAAGETVALFGPNGAGKSTLLRIASTLLNPTGGEIRFQGRPLDRRLRPGYRARIGLVGHATFLYDELAAAENLQLHARLRGVPDPRGRSAALLEEVGLSHRADDRVGTFSRGMQQRLSLARALVAEPDLLLLDEPFSGLDAPGTAVLCRVLRERHARGLTTLLISHDLPLGLSLADRFVLLERGALRMAADAAPWRAIPPHEIGLDGLARGLP